MEQYGDICSLLGLQESPIDSLSSSSYLTDNSCQLIEKTEACSSRVSTEKSFHKENGNFVPSDLLDFLSEDEMKREMDLSDFECLNNLDLELDTNLRGLSDIQSPGRPRLTQAPYLAEPQSRLQSCDLIDTESDSGVESINSLSPQDSPAWPPPPSPLNNPQPDLDFESRLKPAPDPVVSLPLASIQALLPLTPLSIEELSLSSSIPEYLEAEEELMAVPPSLIRKDNSKPHKVPCQKKKECVKKPSLLSSLLSIPPFETKSAKQLSSLMNRELTERKKSQQVSQVDIVNFINSSKFVSEAPGLSFPALDSFKQKHNGSLGRAETELDVRSVPSLENEIMGIKYNSDTDIDSGETHQRKKLIINKRRKELISVTETKKTKPWDGDLRVSTATQSRKNVGTSGDLKAASETEGIPVSTGPPRDPASQRTYLCPTCGVFFPSSAARSLHRRQVHQRHHLCQTCDKAFPTSQKLERHLKTHVKSEKKIKQEYSDPYPQEFKNEENLESHLTNQFTLGTWKIKQESDPFPKEFTNEENLESHLTTPFTLGCHQEYLTGSGLNVQMEQLHSNEGHYKCLICDFVGQTCFELELHSETDHPSTLITSDCCNQPFIDNTELLQSLSTELHSNEKVSECPVNSFRSEAESQMDFQMKTHAISKKHTCSHCGHKFAFKNSLTKHLSKGRCIILKKFPNKT